MRSESLDKPRIFFGILRTTLSELVSFALPVLGPELKRQRYGEFPKKKTKLWNIIAKSVICGLY